MNHPLTFPLTLQPSQFLGNMHSDPSPAPLPGAAWLQAQQVDDGLLYRFPPGMLAGASHLSADLLLDGNHLTVFSLALQEGEHGPAFGFGFGLLNMCQARLSLPLEAVRMNRWRYPRQGALLKPYTYGARVDLNKVDRMTFKVMRKSGQPVRWCMTPITAHLTPPPPLQDPLLPAGKLIDELGQSALHDWPEKTRSPQELIARLHAQAESAPGHNWPGHGWPASFSRWGGWKERRVEANNGQATGFFRTYHDGQRWWLVDPEGYLFWSTGLDCVRVDAEAAYDGLESALSWMPDADGPYRAIYEEHGSEGVHTINYLAANFIRAFGEEKWYERWAEIALAELRRLGFNTVANWSDWEIASRAGIPYVRPLSPTYEALPSVYRDFPDVFHPDFPQVADAFAEPLRASVGDPAFIGYFLMNEPTWGFSSETPAAGMLFNTPSCASRTALREFLKNRYGSDAALSAAWGLPVSLNQVGEGEWNTPLTPAAQADLADFSSVMVEKFFGELSAACRAVDPHHLNLGIRYYTIPPHWALAGMRHFDVFSMNCYRPRLPAEEMAEISALMRQPILIGEWHFGALDVGLPASGIGHVPDQASRGKAYRVYLEDAAAKPWCVGVHYFTLYDQSALGRFDGENYNIGFLDICNRPYEPLAQAARLSHERLYEVCTAQVAPYDDPPEYLPLLFM